MARLGNSVALSAMTGVLLLASACDTECQEFCTAWFDYKQDVCGELDNDDARVSCIADYRGHLVADEELEGCTDLIAQVETLRTSNDPLTRESCCDASTCGLAEQPTN